MIIGNWVWIIFFSINCWVVVYCVWHATFSLDIHLLFSYLNYVTFILTIDEVHSDIYVFFSDIMYIQ